jgi:hypothetical protein
VTGVVARPDVGIVVRQKPCEDGVCRDCPVVPAVVFGGVEARQRWARVRTGGGGEEDMIIILNIINQREMLDPAGKRDEATHHAVKNWAKKCPNFRGRGGGGWDYCYAKRLMLITSRTPDPVMVTA